MLFARDRHAELEVYNDINGDLVNLFRCIQHHPEELIRQLSGILYSREVFIDALSQLGSSGLTDIQRAARYYIVIRESFGADTHTFGINPINLSGTLEFLKKVSDRLGLVCIEHLSYDALIKNNDRVDSLFFCDPPYYGTERYYRIHSFKDSDHLALRDLLLALKGKVILTYNDDEQIRKWYRNFNICSVERLKGINNGSGISKELIITNL